MRMGAGGLHEGPVGGSVVAEHDTASRHALVPHHADFDTMVGHRLTDYRDHAALDEVDMSNWIVRGFQDLANFEFDDFERLRQQIPIASR